MTDLENKQAYFTNLNADNTQVFYTKNYKFWYLQNSKQANFNNETLTGLKKDVRGITNFLGFRNDNIEVATVDMDGYKIKEDEFIEYEMGKVNELLLNSTITSQLKRKLKHYLEFLNTKIPAPEVVNTELFEQIRQRFEAMDKKGYQYAFRTEDDFYNFCNVLALYFDNGTFNDIETIQLNPLTKTRIASTLNSIYFKFIKDDLSLKTNKDFFRIVRFLAPYQEKTDNEIYKALIR